MLKLEFQWRPSYSNFFFKRKRDCSRFGFPLCIRSSFTLGGAGAAIVYKEEDFDELLPRGLEISPIHEVMIDKAMMGWKEYELELLAMIKTMW